MGVFEDLCKKHNNGEKELDVKSFGKDVESQETETVADVTDDIETSSAVASDMTSDVIYSSSTHGSDDGESVESPDAVDDSLEPLEPTNQESTENHDNCDTECSQKESEQEDIPLNDEKEDKVLLELQDIRSEASKMSTELREIRKLYHNEFSGRLQSMQHELDGYHEMDKGRIYDGILAEIARLYSENLSVIEKVDDEKAKKQLRYMFLDYLQMLENYGVQKQESTPGDKRNTRFCQVIERIPTDDQTKHDTVAKSRNIGFFVENRVLVKEMVDVFVYTKPVSNEDDSEAKEGIEN